MVEANSRMTKRGKAPTEADVAAWVGGEAYGYWLGAKAMIDRLYPGVYVPEWLYGGRKHGWSLRYKKGRSFCTLIPEKHRVVLVIVFGAAERASVETIRENLSWYSQNAYDEATTYHDGKWVRLAVDSDAVLEDTRNLLAVKCKPKGGVQTA